MNQKPEKESVIDIRLKCLELACQALQKSQNVIYDKSVETTSTKKDFGKNTPVILDAKGRGIQNMAMTYTNITAEQVTEMAEKFYKFLNKK